MIKTPRIPQIPKNTDQATGRWMLGIQKAIEDAHKGVSRVSDYLSAAPIGGIVMWASPNDPPSGFFLCDGSAKSRTDYEDLYESLTVNKGTFTVTIASPGVVTLTDHGLETGDCVELTTTGALPTGLSANTNYYVIYINSSTFGLATSYANAIASTDINTSGTQSGVHSLRYCPWGISGASDFLLPDYRGIQPEGAGEQGTSSWASANYKGGLGHYKQDRMQGHVHPYGAASGGATNLGNLAYYLNYRDTGSPTTDGTNGTPRTGQTTIGPRAGVKFIIKYAQAAGVDGTDGTDGEDGEDGYDGVGFILSDSTITYDEDGNITQIDYADGQSKTITYNPDGSIDEVLWDRGFETVNKEMLYSSGDLSGVDVTVTKIGAEGRSYASPRRQTVLTGLLDTDGYPNFLTINGSNIDLEASATDPLVISCANGFDQWGADDYIVQHTSDVASAWGSFDECKRYFLSVDIDEDGVVTRNKALVQPQSGYSYDKRRMFLFHFNGTDGSTTFTDEYGNGTWTNGGSNTHLETDITAKFGTASCYFDGVNDYLTSNGTAFLDTSDRWCIDFWLYRTASSVLQALISGESNLTFALQINASNKLLLYISSNGSTWNVAAGTGSAVGVTNVPSSSWCHIAMEWDGSEYRVYLDGSEEIAVASTSAALMDATGIILGCAYDRASYDLTGYIDELRICSGMNWYGANFTPPTAAYDGSEGDPSFYSIPQGKMYYGNPITDTWTASKSVFVGEVETDDAGDPASVVCYAIRGESITQEAVIDDPNEAMYSANHNLGRNMPFSVQIELVCLVPVVASYFYSGQRFIAYCSREADASAMNTVKLIGLSVQFFINYYLYMPHQTVLTGLTADQWNWRTIVQRSF